MAMERYEWSEKRSTYLIEADGSVFEDVEGVGHPQVGEVPRFIAREILRLAEEHEKDLAFMASCRVRVEREERENEELRRCLDFHMLDAARQKAAVQALRGKLKLAAGRVKELEADHISMRTMLVDLVNPLSSYWNQIDRYREPQTYRWIAEINKRLVLLLKRVS